MTESAGERTIGRQYMSTEYDTAAIERRPLCSAADPRSTQWHRRERRDRHWHCACGIACWYCMSTVLADAGEPHLLREAVRSVQRSGTVRCGAGATCNMQRATCNVQRTTCNVQRSTHNVQLHAPWHASCRPHAADRTMQCNVALCAVDVLIAHSRSLCHGCQPTVAQLSL